LTCFAIFFFTAIWFAYWQEIYFLLIPPGLIIVLFLIQNPWYLFYLLIISIPWSFEFSFSPTLATDLPDEPMMILGSIAALMYLVHNRKAFQIKKVHVLSAIIILQVAWTFISVIASTDFILSMKYLLAKGWYVLAFFVLPVILFRDIHFFKKVIFLFLCSMLAVTSVILFKHAGNDWSFDKVNDAVRPFFKNHVSYSSLLVFMVPLLLSVICLTRSKKFKWLFYFLLIGTLMAVYLSYARGAWLALLAGVVAYWLVHKRLLLSGFVFLLLVIIIGTFWVKSDQRLIKFSNDYKSTIYHSNLEEHIIATYQLKDLSNAERIYRWIAGVRMVKDNWQTGWGPSTFYSQYKSYTLPAFKTYVSNNPEKSTVHNYFLLVLIEQGIIGCFLFIMLMATALYYVQKIYFGTNQRFWKVVSASIGSILVMQCVINFLSDLIETDKVGSVFYLCLATLVIADRITRKEKSDLSPHIESIS
jgi:O-antigen ligase